VTPLWFAQAALPFVEFLLLGAALPTETIEW
jgi:hypothetical protein